MPKPGPLTPTEALERLPRAIPATPPSEDDLSKAHLTADDIRARLAARERDIQYHIEALKHEATAVFDDVNVGGRPLMDRVRERPVASTLAALAAGAVLGLAWGGMRRARRHVDPEDSVDFIRARLQVSLEDAARRVARGADVEAAIRASMAEMPVVYGEPGTATAQAKSSTREVVDLAVKSAAGFAAKAAIDLLVRRLTGHEETFAALGDAAD